ncbi:hypothetical protein BTA51_16670 [Hahella sp. CCB-MM4]|uniref:hypothetical protein n=1 Tax=Hahella sp. (strain CCB-MM4) TaxID=1926491 RepID=UPI000B9AEB52|nr:hypothetical protein [Hahella sp. CCB-MM4]OZG72363.1 hypothetical protein BTA51_16670 [Hahella sp. CCB-MM4]
MKFVKHGIVALMLGSFAVGAHAETWKTIQNFNVWSMSNASNLTIRVTGIPIENPESCSDADSYMVQSSIAESGQDRIYSTLLAAAVSGKPVHISLSGCESNRPRITNVVIGKGTGPW